MKRRPHAFLTAAIASALGRVTPPTAPAAPAINETLQRVGLENLRVIPVDPGHAREPLPQRFDLDEAAGVCYVRKADWPKLEAALKRGRKAQA